MLTRIFCFAVLLFAWIPIAVAAPANDDLANAVQLPPSLSYFSADLSQATIEPTEPDFGPLVPAQSSVWFKYTAPRSGNLLLLVAPQNSLQPASFAVDIYKGNGFKGGKRLTLGTASVIGFSDYITTLTKVTANTTYYIRVGGITGQAGSIFAANIYLAPATAQTVVLPLRRAFEPFNPAGIVGPFDNWTEATFRPEYAVLSTFKSAKTVSFTSTIPGATIVSTSQSVPARSSNKPGVAVVSVIWDERDVLLNKIGTFALRITAFVGSGAGRKKTDFPIYLQRYREDRARLVLVEKTKKVSARIGTAGRFYIDIKNDSVFNASGCRISEVRGTTSGYNNSFETKWKVVETGSSVNGPFKLAPGQTKRVLISLKPTFVGRSPGLFVAALCNEAPWERSAGQVSLTGLP